MTKSGILETRSHLSQIINKVMKGNEHIILRKNIAVAKIVPIQEDLFTQAQELIKKTKNLRRSVKKITIAEMNSWKEEGRK